MIDSAKQAQERLKFFLLHYRQTQFLNSLLKEAENFDPHLVSFEMHDDGSPSEIQKQVTAILSCYPAIKAVLHPSNRGVLAILEECLGNSQADYTYFGAGDDAGCPASMQMALRDLKDAKSPLIASDFYVIHMESRSSIYVEAILPAKWMTGETISRQDLEKTLREGSEGVYIATHAALAPTRDLVAAGGFPDAMKWHCDWFSYHVAALRAGLRYASAPLACWRQSPAGYSHAARSGAGTERDVLREMLSTLEKPEYADVRETVLCPNLTPLLDDIARQTLFAILSRPGYWKYFRPGHLRNALHELAAPWIAEEKWGGKVIKWLDENPVALPFRFLRQPFIRLLLRLGGAQVGRKVRFGRKARIREPRGLRIADDVTMGEGVSICAMHPLHVGSGVRIGKYVRLESANSSGEPGVRFFRKKSVVIEHGAVIGEGCVIGPGARIQAGQNIPAGSRLDLVETTPLFVLGDDDQILVDHTVLREWYGLDPQGNPLTTAGEMV